MNWCGLKCLTRILGWIIVLLGLSSLANLGAMIREQPRPLSYLSYDQRQQMLAAIADADLNRIRELYRSGISLDPQLYGSIKPLHQAIETHNLKIVQLILRRCASLPHYLEKCLINAYAYARQRHDHLTTLTSPRGVEPELYQEDLAIGHYLEQELYRHGIYVPKLDYRAIKLYLPMRDSWLAHTKADIRYRFCGSGISNVDYDGLISRLSADQFVLDSAVNPTSDYPSYDAGKIRQARLAPEPVVSSLSSPLLAKNLDLTTPSRPELALDNRDVTVGAGVIAAQSARRVPSATELTTALLTRKISVRPSVSPTACPIATTMRAWAPIALGVGAVVLAVLCARWLATK